MSYKSAESPEGTATITEPTIPITDTTLTLSPLTVNGEVGLKTMFTGKLTETVSGNPIAGKTIHFVVNSIEIGVTAITGANGDFTMEVEWTGVGTHLYKVVYKGD